MGYQYKARNKAGQLMEGILSVDSEKAAALKLEQMGFVPVTILETTGEQQLGTFIERMRGVRFSDLNMFTRLLFTLQKAGLPLLSSLRAIAEQVPNNIFRTGIEQIAKEVEAGSNLSSALEKQPRIFSSIYVSMIRSGEISGKLTEILERLAVLGEHDEKVRLRIRAALKYPAIVIAAIAIAFTILVTLIVPRFEELYNQFTTALPLPTRLLLAVNYVITRFWWAMLLFIAGLVFSFRQFVRTPQGMNWWDDLKLKIPIFGQLILKLIMSRFSRTTGTLLRSGIPILQILDLVAETVGNVIIARTIRTIKVSVNEGEGMLRPMKESGIFPAIVVQMVAAGEETGKLDELLLHVSDYYDSQIEYMIDNLITLIEPFLILVLGTIVLFMALGIFLPMWSIMDLFQQ